MATLSVDVSDATRKQRGLLALALCGGNSERAAERCGIPPTSLRRWRQEDREEYERVCRELAPRLEQVVVAEMYSTVIELGNVERQALALLEEALRNGEIKGKDLATTLKSITWSKAVNTDKILALSGRPTSVVEHRSANDIVRKLAALGAVTDATAVELPEESSPAT